MQNRVRKLAAAAALAMAAASASAGPAAGQEPTAAVRGKRAGDFVIGLSAIGVLPVDGGNVTIIGGKPNVSNSATGQLDFTYFVSDNIALNLIAATTRHTAEVQGSAIGTVQLGHVWALPPTLTLQYHPLPRRRFSPYAGLGINFTIFYGEGGSYSPPVTNVKINNAAGMAVNFGTDYEIAPNWLLNFDVKKIFFLEPNARVDTAVGRIDADVNISPWVIGGGIRYRF